MDSKGTDDLAPGSSHYESAENRVSCEVDESAPPSGANLKTRDGFVLVPQPSDDPNDPLNWSSFRKHAALFMISWQALLCFITVTTLVPATLLLEKEFGVTKSTAIYLGSTPVLLYGIAPWFWGPLSHFAGRRPVLLLSCIVAMVGTIVAATATTYGACMTGRVLLGFGGSAFWTLGPASIDGMFFRHEKGTKIGMSTLAIVTASFVGGVIGGPIVDSMGWRASQWIPLIFIGAGFIGQIFFLPETIYRRSRHLGEQPPPPKPTLWSRYGVSIPVRDRETEHSFLFLAMRPFVLFRFPTVILPSFWFGTLFTMMVGITAVIPLIFEPQFGFSELDVGLASFAGLIGCLIGEAWAGPSINYLTRRCLKQGKEFQPEVILKAIWPALVAGPGGLIMFGTSIQFGKAWITPLIGWALYTFGIEVGTTVVQTYILECYAPQRAEVSLVFNMFRNVMTWTAAFFIVPMIDNVDTSSPYGLFGALTVVFFPFTIGVLMWRGKKIREKSGAPGWS